MFPKRTDPLRGCRGLIPWLWKRNMFGQLCAIKFSEWSSSQFGKYLEAFRNVPHISMWEIKTWSAYMKFIGFPVSSSLGPPFTGLLLLSFVQLEAQTHFINCNCALWAGRPPYASEGYPSRCLDRHGPGKRLMLTHMLQKWKILTHLNRFDRTPNMH